MTRKHFIALANLAVEIIQNLSNPTEWDTQMVIRECAATCKLHDKSMGFDSKRFNAYIEKRLVAVSA